MRNEKVVYCYFMSFFLAMEHNFVYQTNIHEHVYMSILLNDLPYHHVHTNKILSLRYVAYVFKTINVRAV